MRRIYMLVLTVVMIFVLAGCSKKTATSVQEGPKLYFINKDDTKLVGESYVQTESGRSDLVEEYIRALMIQPEDVNCKRALPEDVTVLDYSFGEVDQLILNFDTNYYNMTGVREILARAAIVKMFCQIKGIQYVEFYVNGQPLVLSGEQPVSMMKADDFLDTTGKMEDFSQYTTISIYFANEDGTKLVESTREVIYDSNITMEQLVIEQLIEGPVEKEIQNGMQKTMPEGTILNSAKTANGVCYVDFNEKFLEKLPDVSEEVTIYAIVNSLIEQGTINKVQITINGEEKKLYQNIPLTDLFERNLDLIEGES
ncbi:MAG: hypothetical protein E7256_10880 [Lachnospiraceae bacterium]|nr:hypothetical protein [Lachnospiraceae bacterium]